MLAASFHAGSSATFKLPARALPFRWKTGAAVACTLQQVRPTNTHQPCKKFIGGHLRRPHCLKRSDMRPTPLGSAHLCTGPVPRDMYMKILFKSSKVFDLSTPFNGLRQLSGRACLSQTSTDRAGTCIMRCIIMHECMAACTKLDQLLVSLDL